MLQTDEWKAFGAVLGPAERAHLNLAWHRLHGERSSHFGIPQLSQGNHAGWPDTVEGLYALKKQFIIATLSNGNVRLLVDMAKHADLPWDTVFSAELFASFKPYVRPLVMNIININPLHLTGCIFLGVGTPKST